LRRFNSFLVLLALVFGFSAMAVEPGMAAPGGGDVSVTKACPDIVNPNEVFSCVITVTHVGGATATNVEVVDAATAGAKFEFVSASGGATCQSPAVGSEGNSIKCTFPTVASGAPQTMTVHFRGAPGSPCKSTITNTATATDAQAGDTNDSDQETITVECDRPSPQQPQCTIGDPDATTSQTLRGTEGPDVICGGSAADSIQGLGGDDIIFGGGGNDSIQGNAGNDTIFGGTGDDSIAGNEGNDTMFGNDGNDALQGLPGYDTANGGGGYDRCVSAQNTECEASQTAATSPPPPSS
jgi:Ca2+-binding RTX toxin-like protein